jgi:hypothetical protein
MLAAGIALLAVGATLALIHYDGSDQPFADQWAAEGATLFRARLYGLLGWSNFFQPHGEHHPALMRGLAYGLFMLNAVVGLRMVAVDVQRSFMLAHRLRHAIPPVKNVAQGEMCADVVGALGHGVAPEGQVTVIILITPHGQPTQAYRPRQEDHSASPNAQFTARDRLASGRPPTVSVAGGDSTGQISQRFRIV